MMDYMEENWKDVVGYEGLYKVSNLGNVRSIARRVMKFDGTYRVSPAKLLSPSNSHGYRTVSLSKEGLQKKFSVHRLVALAFIPNPENKPFIDHKNNIRHDNRVENLHWVTPLENQRNPITNANRTGMKHWNYKKNFGDKWISNMRKSHQKYAIKVNQYDKNGNLIATYRSVRDAGRLLGVPSNCISRACKSVTATAYGYIWKYTKEQDYLREHGYPTYGAELAVLNNYSENTSEYLEAWQTYMGVRHDAKTWAENQSHREDEI